MKIILKEDDKKLGKKNTIITVKDGYGTYLINEGKALIANEGNMKRLASDLKKENEIDEACRKVAVQVKHVIENSIYYIDKNYNEKTKQINGSITKKDVLDALISENFPYSLEQSSFITFPKAKYANEVYTGKLKIYKDIIADVKFKVRIV